ncbi:MAG: DUF2993 domain-containing protein [Terrimesophilobacter sp.]
MSGGVAPSPASGVSDPGNATLRPARPRKRRRRTITVAVIVGVLLVLGIGAIFLDNWARQQVADFVATKIQQSFNLKADDPVTVDVAGFSVLGQLATGTLNEVSADINDVPFGDLRGHVHVTLTDIPIDETQPVGELRAEFRMTESTVAELVQTLSTSAVTNVELVEPEIRLGTKINTPRISLFGVTIPSIPLALAVGLEPKAADGQLSFAPTSVEVNGAASTVDKLRSRYGSLVDAVLAPKLICIAQWLPKPLKFDTASVHGKELVLTFSATQQVLSTAAFGVRGSCN